MSAPLLVGDRAAQAVLDAYRSTWSRRGARTRRSVVVRDGGCVVRSACGTGETDFASGWSSAVLNASDGGGLEIRKLGFRTYQRTLPPDGPPDRWTVVDLERHRLDSRPRDRVAVLEATLTDARHHGVRTTRAGAGEIFVVTVDLTRMERDAGLSPGLLGRAFEGTSLHRFELTVGPDGVVVSETSVLSGPTDDGTECFRAGSTSTLELVELDVEAAIELPAESEVDDITERVMADLTARSGDTGCGRIDRYPIVQPYNPPGVEDCARQ